MDSLVPPGGPVIINEEHLQEILDIQRNKSYKTSFADSSDPVDNNSLQSSTSVLDSPSVQEDEGVNFTNNSDDRSNEDEHEDYRASDVDDDSTIATVRENSATNQANRGNSFH